MAHIGLHLQCDLLELDEELILDYLHMLKSKRKTPFDIFFKHTVYGLRYLYRIFDRTESRVILPSIERQKALPVVLSQQEVRLLLKTPKLLKHRLMMALLYGWGLRNYELCNLKLVHLDLERAQPHIQQGKGRKDRYVPVCDLLIRGVKTYLQAEKPVEYLFNGQADKEGGFTGISTRGVQWVMRQARQHSGIKKQITAHTLRHSYATHLLEMGTDIITLKDLLGHGHIETTLIYLHVARVSRALPFSPLEKLYPQ